MNIDAFFSASGFAQFAENVGLDIETASGASQVRLLLNETLLLGFDDFQNAPIAIAEDPNISIDNILAAIPADGLLRLDIPDIDVSVGSMDGVGDLRVLDYREGSLAFSAVDGLIIMKWLTNASSRLTILDLINADYPGAGNDDNTPTHESILFFKIMHETFGIPYESMEIYAYDGLDFVVPEDFWPEKTLVVYWGGDGDYVVPVPASGDLAARYDSILDYDIRIVPPPDPFTFRRWFDPQAPGDSSLLEPETELNLVMAPCPEICTKSLFENDLFHAGYYESGNYPYETIQIQLDAESASNTPFWAVAYLIK